MVSPEYKNVSKLKKKKVFVFFLIFFIYDRPSGGDYDYLLYKMH